MPGKGSIPPRSDPYISANKLGEYVVAKPRRRRSIIVDQKTPSEFKVARYVEANNAIVASLLAGCSPDPIAEAIDKLGKKKPTTKWDGERIENCILALQAFAGLLPDLNFEGLALSKGATDASDLVIAGVAVSVRPEIIAIRKNKTGPATTGAIKIHTSKSFPHDEESAHSVGVLAHDYLEKYYAKKGKPKPSDCFVLDVFAQEIHCAPSAMANRRKDIVASCEEIKATWTTLA